MRVGIVGSRRAGKEKYSFIKKKIDEVLEKFGVEDVVIVSGGARGIDKMAERYAREKGYKLEVFYPNYDLYGRKAPLIRNEKIAERCDLLIAFPDDKSRGTWHCVRKATEFGKVVVVIKKWWCNEKAEYGSCQMVR